MYNKFYFTVSDGWIRPYMLAEPVLLSAPSFARRGFPNLILPAQVPEVAVDCGGFVAAMHGGYTFTIDQYVEWLFWIRPVPSWAAMLDLCCEEEITAGRPGLVRERQEWTTEMAWRIWDGGYRYVPWMWMTTVQGWTIPDYRFHARQLRPLIELMRGYYGKRPLVGIGTLCRRASVQMIQEIVNVVAEELPDVDFHLWGVKRRTLEFRAALHPQVVSSDSAAWNNHFGHAIETRRQSGKSERRWAWEDSAVEYRDKIQAALKQPKQLSLFAQPGGVDEQERPADLDCAQRQVRPDDELEN